MKFSPKGSLLAIAAGSLAVEYSAMAPAPAMFRLDGAAAVVTIRGPLVQHVDCCFDSYEAIDSRVDAALASSASTLVLCFDSPGGEVAGGFELAAHIKASAAAAGKRVISFVDGMACSAAYALACAAGEIYATPSSIVGSIGVAKMLCDATVADRMQGLAMVAVTSGARKADGNPHVQITEESVAAAQREIDASAALFFSLVAYARGLPVASVAGLQASTYLAAEAAARGLIDGVSTYSSVLAMAAGGVPSARMGEESKMTARENALAALRALAESDDAEDKKCAAAALAAFEPAKEPDGDEGKKAEHSEPDGDEPVKAAAAVEPDGDEEKPAAKAAAKASASLALMATVQSLTARLDAKERAEERASLMAARPDFTPEVRGFLARQNIETLRDAVKSLPRGAAASSPLAAARAAIDATPTRGEGHVGDADGIANLSNNAALLDAAMGSVKVTNPVSFERNIVGIRAMTRSEAKDFLAAQTKKGGEK
jgi:ClpP class serine protease